MSFESSLSPVVRLIGWSTVSISPFPFALALGAIAVPVGGVWYLSVVSVLASPFPGGGVDILHSLLVISFLVGDDVHPVHSLRVETIPVGIGQSTLPRIPQ